MSLSHKLIKHDHEGLFWSTLLKMIERAENEYEDIGFKEMQILSKFLNIPQFGSGNFISHKHLVSVKAPDSVDIDYVKITDWMPISEKIYDDWLNYIGMYGLEDYFTPKFFDEIIDRVIYDRRQFTNTRGWDFDDFEKAPKHKYVDSKFNWEKHIFMSEKTTGQAIIADIITMLNALNGEQTYLSFKVGGIVKITFPDDFTYVTAGYIAYHLGILKFKHSLEDDTRTEIHEKFIKRIKYIDEIPHPPKALIRHVKDVND